MKNLTNVIAITLSLLIFPSAFFFYKLGTKVGYSSGKVEEATLYSSRVNEISTTSYEKGFREGQQISEQSCTKQLIIEKEQAFQLGKHKSDIYHDSLTQLLIRSYAEKTTLREQEWSMLLSDTIEYYQKEYNNILDSVYLLNEEMLRINTQTSSTVDKFIDFTEFINGFKATISESTSSERNFIFFIGGFFILFLLLLYYRSRWVGKKIFMRKRIFTFRL